MTKNEETFTANRNHMHLMRRLGCELECMKQICLHGSRAIVVGETYLRKRSRGRSKFYHVDCFEAMSL